MSMCQVDHGETQCCIGFIKGTQKTVEVALVAFCCSTNVPGLDLISHKIISVRPCANGTIKCHHLMVDPGCVFLKQNVLMGQQPQSTTSVSLHVPHLMPAMVVVPRAMVDIKGDDVHQPVCLQASFVQSIVHGTMFLMRLVQKTSNICFPFVLETTQSTHCIWSTITGHP